MTGPMAPPRRLRRRFRSASPLDVRSWVIGLTPPEVYEELSRRIEVLDATARPHADLLLQGGLHLVAATLATLGRDDTVGPLPADVQGIAVRVGIANMVAAHWAEHEYRPGTFLPRS